VTVALSGPGAFRTTSCNRTKALCSSGSSGVKNPVPRVYPVPEGPNEGTLVLIPPGYKSPSLPGTPNVRSWKIPDFFRFAGYGTILSHLRDDVSVCKSNRHQVPAAIPLRLRGCKPFAPSLLPGARACITGWHSLSLRSSRTKVRFVWGNVKNT
jgi:hypothetical protein